MQILDARMWGLGLMVWTLAAAPASSGAAPVAADVVLTHARIYTAADPQLAEEFKRKLKSDPAFAKDPAARLQVFYRRHSSWDERFNLYAVMRTATVP